MSSSFTASSTNKRKERPDKEDATAGGLNQREPKRSLNAYNFYFREERRRIVEEYENGHRATVPSFREMGKIIGGRWKRITPEERAPYKVLAAEDSARYRREKKLHYEAQVAAMCGYYNDLDNCGGHNDRTGPPDVEQNLDAKNNEDEGGNVTDLRQTSCDIKAPTQQFPSFASGSVSPRIPISGISVIAGYPERARVDAFPSTTLVAASQDQGHELLQVPPANHSSTIDFAENVKAVLLEQIRLVHQPSTNRMGHGKSHAQLGTQGNTFVNDGNPRLTPEQLFELEQALQQQLKKRVVQPATLCRQVPEYSQTQCLSLQQKLQAMSARQQQQLLAALQHIPGLVLPEDASRAQQQQPMGFQQILQLLNHHALSQHESQLPLGISASPFHGVALPSTAPSESRIVATASEENSKRVLSLRLAQLHHHQQIMPQHMAQPKREAHGISMMRRARGAIPAGTFPLPLPGLYIDKVNGQQDQQQALLSNHLITAYEQQQQQNALPHHNYSPQVSNLLLAQQAQQQRAKLGKQSTATQVEDNVAANITHLLLQQQWQQN
uniref:HMG box domain-containing protein n=1 Tax=Odontella aurita TaxID=265563 RepID=A0A7S4IYJ8_9STRA|mmetsp:Transcript_33315/g.99181  ORF Transcript_33315/g.99181 Transcript_33315/m.99181 type:complete len:554 (+) Transcript_33315:36-1697(+)